MAWINILEYRHIHKLDNRQLKEINQMEFLSKCTFTLSPYFCIYDGIILQSFTDLKKFGFSNFAFF